MMTSGVFVCVLLFLSSNQCVMAQICFPPQAQPCPDTLGYSQATPGFACSCNKCPEGASTPVGGFGPCTPHPPETSPTPLSTPQPPVIPAICITVQAQACVLGEGYSQSTPGSDCSCNKCPQHASSPPNGLGPCTPEPPTTMVPNPFSTPPPPVIPTICVPMQFHDCPHGMGYSQMKPGTPCDCNICPPGLCSPPDGRGPCVPCNALPITPSCFPEQRSACPVGMGFSPITNGGRCFCRRCPSGFCSPPSGRGPCIPCNAPPITPSCFPQQRSACPVGTGFSPITNGGRCFCRRCPSGFCSPPSGRGPCIPCMQPPMTPVQCPIDKRPATVFTPVQICV